MGIFSETFEGKLFVMDPLPHNIQIEKGILSAMLIDAESALGAMYCLEPRDFYRTSHRQIFQACLELKDVGQQVAMDTVASRLIETGNLKNGIAYYMASLSDFPMAVSVPHAASKLKEFSIRRRLIWSAEQITKMARGGGIDAIYKTRDVLNRIVNKFESCQATAGMTTGDPNEKTNRIKIQFI